jgi:MFS family permease
MHWHRRRQRQPTNKSKNVDKTW